MKDKYYTPTLEEFHIGFEYEAFIKGGKTVLPRVFPEYPRAGINWGRNTGKPIEIVKYLIESDKCRVKYLDREDIESLGFELISGACFSLPLGTGEELRLLFENDMLVIFLADKYSNKLFQGTIKNISELKRILKQVGYDN